MLCYLIFDIKYKMRQQSESHPQSHNSYTHESNQARKERMDKKRAIRKNKIGYQPQQATQIIRSDKMMLSKQQKVQLQKAKNRQAAQRSRDQHRKYVQTLEEQITKLRQQLSKPKYCIKCSKQIFSQTEQSSDSNQIEFQYERRLQTFAENQNNQDHQHLQEFQSPFIRMNDYQQSSSLKMFLFISMIVLGIFLLNGNTQSSTLINETLVKRDLMQIKNQNNEKMNKIIKNNYIEEQVLNIKNLKDQKQMKYIKKFDIMNQIQNRFNMQTQIEDQKVITQIVPLSYQLSPLDQQNCLKSIINKNYTVKKVNNFLNQEKKFQFVPKLQKIKASSLISLRQNPNYQMQIFSSQAQHSNNHNILFCSLPKLYKQNSELIQNDGFLSKFIDIIISGSEIMQIFGTSPNIWMNKMIHFNGIYKINAQVKQIVHIEDKNCIQ